MFKKRGDIVAGMLKQGTPGHDLTTDELRKGGINSGEARREKGLMLATLEKILKSNDKEGKLYNDNVALGLIANAIDKTKGGNPEAYKVIAKMLGELDISEESKETPSVSINIVDNSNLEKALYEKGDE